MARSPYASVYDRLVSNTHEPANEQDCWRWKRTKDRSGYGRFNLYVPGLGTEVKLMTHLALWACLHAGAQKADDVYLAYQEFVNSGLELDHLCAEASCLHPDHLNPVTPLVNNALMYQRRRYA